MNNNDLNREDELRSEYDLNSLKVRKLGPERRSLVGDFVLRESESHLNREQADVALEDKMCTTYFETNMGISDQEQLDL